MPLMPAIIRLASIVSIAALSRLGDRRRDTSFDNFVQLATTEPYTAAPGTVIDLDILPLRHNQIDLAHRAQKASLRVAILIRHLILSKS